MNSLVSIRCLFEELLETWLPIDRIDDAHGIGVQNVTSNYNVATLNCFFPFLLIVS